MKHHLASDLSWTKEGKQGSTTRNCWNVEALPLSPMHGPFNVGSLLLESAGIWKEGTTREGWQSRPMLSAQRHSSGLLLLILKQILRKSKKILWMKRWPSSKTQIHLVYLFIYFFNFFFFKLKKFQVYTCSPLYIKHIWMFFNPMKKYAFPPCCIRYSKSLGPIFC